jgi:hypothetical protein|nr:MAG TPA: head closure knob [Caudoviricetes sp.]
MDSITLRLVKDTLDKSYKDTADVFVTSSQEINGITYDDIETKLNQEPIKCLLDYNNNRIAKGVVVTSEVEATLFLNNDVDIPLNSKIVITRLKQVYQYRSIAIARKYETHQEIDLKAIDIA